jgi:uncharacterized membrane protein YsdA (DUF1294 family)
MGDRVIECVECGQKFLWTEGDQRFYREHGWVPPKRCKACRQQRDREYVAGGLGEMRWGAVQYRIALITFALAVGGALLLHRFVSSLGPVLSWLVAINVVTFFTYVYDKAISGQGIERVPESVLLALALVGGTVGALAGMKWARHKTAKESFQMKLLVVVAVQFLLALVYAFVWRR